MYSTDYPRRLVPLTSHCSERRRRKKKILTSITFVTAENHPKDRQGPREPEETLVRSTDTLRERFGAEYFVVVSNAVNDNQR